MDLADSFFTWGARTCSSTIFRWWVIALSCSILLSWIDIAWAPGSPRTPNPMYNFLGLCIIWLMITPEPNLWLSFPAISLAGDRSNRLGLITTEELTMIRILDSPAFFLLKSKRFPSMADKLCSRFIVRIILERTNIFTPTDHVRLVRCWVRWQVCQGPSSWGWINSCGPFSIL